MNRAERGERDEFLVQNYVKFGVRECSKKLGISVKSVYLRVYKLRQKGLKIAYIRESRKGEVVEAVKAEYGIKTTKKIARKLGVAPGYVQNIAYKLGISFWTHQGGYNFWQLARLLGVSHQRVARWARHHGLRVRYKINSKGPHEINVVDIEDLKRFLEKVPEILVGLSKSLSPKTRVLLELEDPKVSRREKFVKCKPCGKGFWTEIDQDHLHCPECGCFCSQYGLRYR